MWAKIQLQRIGSDAMCLSFDVALHNEVMRTPRYKINSVALYEADSIGAAERKPVIR